MYLNSRIIIGECCVERRPAGADGRQRADGRASRDLGFPIRRFKTGTPARLDGRTIDFSRMEPQYGDEPIVPFSFLTDPAATEKPRAVLSDLHHDGDPSTSSWTTSHRAPMYAGAIHGTGARYCPSIEDKVVRFKDKERHPVFLEPEGL